MPSPIGHALGGAAAGLAVAGLRLDASHHAVWRRMAVFAALGMLPDLDLLIGAHRGPSHSVGASLIAFLAALAMTRSVRLSLAAAAAYGSHTVLDWLGADTSAPIGVMALWPFDREHYQSGIHLFRAVSRRYWVPGFVMQNVRAVAWEMMILLPALALVLAVPFAARRRRTSGALD